MAHQFLSALFQAMLSVDIFHCLYLVFIMGKTMVRSLESYSRGTVLNLLSIPVFTVYAHTEMFYPASAVP